MNKYNMYQGGKKKSKARCMQRNREYIRQRKELSGGCCVCGEARIPCLDYHHKDPKDKGYNVNDMIKSHSLESIDREINKCMVLCANCHRLLHAKELLQKVKETGDAMPLFNSI